MGTCMSIDLEKDCIMCYGALENKYIHCGHCKCRFHYKCLMAGSPTLDHCINCKKQQLRFIDMRIDDRTQTFSRPTSARVKRRHYTI